MTKVMKYPCPDKDNLKLRIDYNGYVVNRQKAINEAKRYSTINLKEKAGIQERILRGHPEHVQRYASSWRPALIKASGCTIFKSILEQCSKNNEEPMWMTNEECFHCIYFSAICPLSLFGNKFISLKLQKSHSCYVD